jgi:membrane protein required for colicin V production
MHGFTLLDILLWLAMLAFAAKGFMKGLFREVCSLLGFVAGAWAAFAYYKPVSSVVGSFIKLPQNISSSLSFILIYIVLGILFFFAGHLLTVIFKIMMLGWLNRVGGVLLAVLQGAFIASLILAVSSGPSAPMKIKSYIQLSHTASTFSKAGRDIIDGWTAAHPAASNGRQ